MINNRILSVDVLRGGAIAIILVVHRIHYQWTGMQTHEALKTNLHGPWAPLIVAIIALFTMAGVFYFISGLVNAYSINKRVNQNICARSKWMWGGVLSGIILILFNYIHRTLFMNGFNPDSQCKEPEFPAGYLTGWIRDSQAVSFQWTQLTEPGTLSLIGFVIIIVTLTLGWIYKNGVDRKSNSVYTLLTVIAVLLLLATPFVKYWLRPVYEQAYENRDYFFAGILGHLCQEFCIFPYLGYGFVGAILGISLARKENKKIFIFRARIWMISLFLAGIVGLLLFDRSDPMGKRIMGACVSYAELAIFTLILIGFLKYLDYFPGEKIEKRWRKTLGIRRMGMVALTIYFFEPLVAEVLRKFMDAVLGTEWTKHFQYVLLFGFACLYVWWIIIRYWSKVNYAGSIEWITAYLLLRITGKRSTKTDFRSLKENQSRT
jgi:hypothetical protein